MRGQRYDPKSKPAVGVDLKRTVALGLLLGLCIVLGYRLKFGYARTKVSAVRSSSSESIVPPTNERVLTLAPKMPPTPTPKSAVPRFAKTNVARNATSGRLLKAKQQLEESKLAINGYYKVPESRFVEIKSGEKSSISPAAGCSLIDAPGDVSVVYLHVTKAAGSFIQNVMRDTVKKHNSLYPENPRTIRGGCKHMLKKNVFTFSFVRNPWARHVSVYAYVKKDLMMKERREPIVAKKEFLRSKIKSFEAMCPWKKVRSDSKILRKCPGSTIETHWSTQVSQSYGGDGFPRVDYLPRMNTLHSSLGYVMDLAGMRKAYDSIEFTMHNDAAHKPYNTYYEDPKQLEHQYRVDADVLGFDFLDAMDISPNVTKFRDGKSACELGLGVDC